mmetsp:Transcript_19839/g.35986  ORF Transcript_19839/g.35986 Transcript_19839/m.35986 type:complete len:232 (+) Transcript_19839:312-1007(+)
MECTAVHLFLHGGSQNSASPAVQPQGAIFRIYYLHSSGSRMGRRRHRTVGPAVHPVKDPGAHRHGLHCSAQAPPHFPALVSPRHRALVLLAFLRHGSFPSSLLRRNELLCPCCDVRLLLSHGTQDQATHSACGHHGVSNLADGCRYFHPVRCDDVLLRGGGKMWGALREPCCRRSHVRVVFRALLSVCNQALRTHTEEGGQEGGINVPVRSLNAQESKSSIIPQCQGTSEL